MNDKEIIKALECCTTNGASCKDCPAFVKVDRSNCKKYFRGALDLINRLEARIGIYETCNARKDEAIKHLEAENERLNGYLDVIGYSTDKIKAEAYKEFVDKLHEELRMYGVKDKFNKSVFLNVVDKAKKEKVGEDK